MSATQLESDEFTLEPWSPRETKFKEMGTCMSLPKPNKLPDVILHDGHVIAGENNQDWVYTGKTDSDHPAIVVLDGHGKGKVLEFLKRSVYWSAVLDMDDPCKHIRSMINTGVSDIRRDGSTFVSVEVVENGFRCRWLGDSEIAIFYNEELCWKSSKHSNENKKEKDRILQQGIQVNNSYTLECVDDSTMTMVDGGYCIWEKNDAGVILDQTTCTRSFGHSVEKNIEDAETRFIKFNKAGRWRAIAYTDGVSDVTHKNDINLFGKSSMNASSIASHCRKRWEQPWKYLHPESCPCPSCKTTRAYDETPTHLGTPDDIGVAILEVDVKL